MPQVRVWNDNKLPFAQKWRDHDIKIGPGAHILMDEDEAYMFQGAYYPPVLDADGNDRPEGFKMIRIEHLRSGEQAQAEAQAEAAKKVDSNICQACRYQASNAKDLDEHLKTHAGSALKDELAEKAMKEKGNKHAS